MWNVEDGEIIDFPGSKFSHDDKDYTVFYLVNPELVVTYECTANKCDELTAYRPNKK